MAPPSHAMQYLLPIIAMGNFAAGLTSRVVDPVLPQISQQMAVSITTAATLASASAIAFAFVQLPLGLVADFFGRAFFGSISGTMAFFLTGARALAPVGAGIAYGYWGDYRPVLWMLACISLLGAVAMLGARRQRAHQTAYDFVHERS